MKKIQKLASMIFGVNNMTKVCGSKKYDKSGPIKWLMMFLSRAVFF